MKRSLWYVVLGGLALSGTVAATTLDDWKEASRREGCASIPYESIRSSCMSKGSEVDAWCKSSSRPISCEDLNPAGITKKIDNVNGKISDLKRERDELSSQISNAKEDSARRDLEEKKKAKESEIYEFEKKVDAWQRDYTNEQTAVNDRIYNGERCVGFREEVARLFSEAKSSARSESDPENKPYAAKLISYWESEESGHAKSIGNYKTAVENCKRMK